MATLEQEIETIYNLRTILRTFVEADVQTFARNDLGEKLNFNSALPNVEKIVDLFKSLNELALENLPHETIIDLLKLAEDANSELQEIMNFSIEYYSRNPIEKRDEIIEKIRASYSNYYSSIIPHIAYANSIKKVRDVESIEADVRKKYEQIDNDLAAQKSKHDKILSESSAILEKVKLAAQEVGIAQHAAHFQNQANEHNDSSRKWLKTTISLSSLTLSFAVGSLILYYSKIATWSLSQNIQLTIAKLIIISVLFAATVWAGNMYKAHRHNYVINKHRQNALSTFETFIKSSNDNQTKNAVLIQTTQCIFSPQHTGYSIGEQDTSSNPQILEIVKGLSE